MIALLLIRPGSLRDGLDALLVSIAEVHLIAHPKDYAAALDFCSQNMTELIVLEIRPDDHELLDVVCKLKALCPQGNVLALIHDESDRQPAEEAQVDLILGVGTSAQRLKTNIQSLVSSAEESN